jgi:hypothetical protein
MLAKIFSHVKKDYFSFKQKLKGLTVFFFNFYLVLFILKS